jgi:O-antigen/teichoic acid export membrane protein
VKEMVNDQIEIALLLITPLILGFYFLAPLLIRVLYSKEFLDVVLILKLALFAVIIKAIIWPLAFIILAKGEKRLYFKQEILGDAMNIGVTILLYEYLGLLGIGLAMLVNYVLYGIYVFKIVQTKFQFNLRKATIGIIIKSALLGALSALTVLVFDYSITTYCILGALCLVSLYYSYVELNKRINVLSYLLKFKNKWKK